MLNDSVSRFARSKMPPHSATQATTITTTKRQPKRNRRNQGFFMKVKIPKFNDQIKHLINDLWSDLLPYFGVEN